MHSPLHTRWRRCLRDDKRSLRDDKLSTRAPDNKQSTRAPEFVPAHSLAVAGWDDLFASRAGHMRARSRPAVTGGVALAVAALCAYASGTHACPLTSLS